MSSRLSLSVIFCFLSIYIFAQPTWDVTANGISRINEFAISQNGTHWCATNDGVTEIASAGQSYTHHYRSGSTPTPFYTVDANNTHVVAAGMGFVALYDMSTWTVYDQSNSSIASTDDFNTVCITNSNVVYALSNSRNLYINTGSGFPTTTASVKALAHDYVTDKIYTVSGTTNVTIQEIHNGNTTTLPYPTSTNGFTVQILELKAVNGNLWARTTSGVIKYNRSTQTWDTYHSSFVSNLILLESECYIIKNQGLYRVVNQTQLDTLANPMYTFDPLYTSVLGHGKEIIYSMSNSIVHIYASLIPKNLVNTLTGGSLEANFLPTGDLNYDLYQKAGLTFQGKSVIFASNIWYTADEGGSTIATSPTFRQFGYQTFSGPFAHTYDSTYFRKYDHVWTVTKDEIDAHKRLYNSPIYKTPKSISSWPANGDVSNGEDQVIAPFEDNNLNGIYEPQLGEVPLIRGDQAAFFIFNDFRGVKTLSDGNGSAMEFQCMAYSFDTTNEAIANAIFMSVKAINRSNSTLNSVKFGLWSDFDLGNSGDDQIGTDSVLQMCYVQNADLEDEGPFGFGLNPPAAGISFLSHTAQGAMYYENGSSPAMGNPNTVQDISNLMSSTWKDGVHLVLENPCGPNCTSSGDGYAASGTPTNWYYNDVSNWYQNPFNFGDTRSVIYSEAQSIPSGDKACLDYVYFAARDLSSLIPNASTDLLKSNLNEIQQFYSTRNYACLSEGISVEEVESKNDFVVYPIPAKSGTNLMITNASPFQSVDLINTNGQVIYSSVLDQPSSECTIPLPQVPSGIYILHCKLQNGEMQISKVAILE